MKKIIIIKPLPTMNKLQTVYQWVKASEVPMPVSEWIHVRYNANLFNAVAWMFENGKLMSQWETEIIEDDIEWLQPTQAILITQEQFDAYEKCVEALKDAEKYLSETLYENGKPIQLNYIGAGSKLHNDFKYSLSLLTSIK